MDCCSPEHIHSELFQVKTEANYKRKSWGKEGVKYIFQHKNEKVKMKRRREIKEIKLSIEQFVRGLKCLLVFGKQQVKNTC